MKQNLDILKSEIQEYLESRNFVVYHGFSRSLEPGPVVLWDTDRFPDFKLFLQAAEASAMKLIVLHTRSFSVKFVENALDQLGEAELSNDERRSIERRLREMRSYDGFTCAIELSFDFGQRTYIFDLRTEWYDEFSDLLDEIDSAIPDVDDDEEDEGPIGGYFSKN
jgi:hypothetical protein